MTNSQRIQAKKRVAKRNGMDNIWFLIAGLFIAAVVFTAVGFINWGDTTPVVETSPVNIEQAVQSGGLLIEGN